MTTAQVLSCQLAAFLAALLAASAAHKVFAFARARQAVREFARIPDFAAQPALVASIAGELLAAALLFVPAYRVLGALLASLVLTVYLALIVRSLVSGRSDVDCGCSFGPAKHRLGAFEAGRNAVLVGLALLAAASSAPGAGSIAASQVLAAGALVAVYAALDQAMALQPMRRGTVL